MRARMMVERPEEIEMTLKLTMTMKQWDMLRNQLDTQWPSWKLSTAITKMLNDARRVYHAEETDCFSDN